MLEEELLKANETPDNWEQDPLGASLDNWNEAGFTVIKGG
jgi:hypothetical protein